MGKSGKSFFKMHKKAGIALVVILLLICCGACSTPNTQSNAPSASTSSISKQTVTSKLSFTVNAGAWDTAADGNLVVKIEGTDSTGKSVSEQYKAVPGTKYDTDLKPGTYVIALASANPAKGNRLFTASPVDANFSGESDVNAVLNVQLDQAAMDAAEAQRKAAEKAAKQEAEEKAAAEAAAKAASQPNANSGVTAQGGTERGQSVYIASSGKGKKYHSNPNCSNMKGTTALSVSEAQSRGYSPCKKCY